MFNDATINEINEVMQHATAAFTWYRKVNREQKAVFLENIAAEIEALGDTLIETASAETNLPAARLQGERARTTGQLRMFAAMVREGKWVEATIDRAIPDRTPLPKPDLRKMLIPLGPVIVFGASNFPFAYSTAGGDTASALAAGCPVVVKAHPAHPQTGELVFSAIRKAIGKSQMHPKIFQQVHGSSFEVGKALVQHPATAAVGFTGSSAGGRALFDYAQERLHPIPVFAEMGSVNPVVLLPDTIERNAASLAKQFAGSITLGMGQFCTKPGILLAIETTALTDFIQQLTEAFEYIEPAKMLHEGIHTAYAEKMNKAAGQPGVAVISQSVVEPEELEPLPTLATVSGKSFLQNPLLHEEVFGPYALLVKCSDKKELVAALNCMGGQLTTSLMGTDADFETHADMVQTAAQMAGRIVFNGVPTGVEVCTSMVHGGPSPATTDSRFTAVGIDAVKRWARPVCFQNCPQHLLPEELRD
jgi:2,5-dioxopentanoate dehydrogenase